MPESSEPKMLPDASPATARVAPPINEASLTTSPMRQMADLPRDELRHLAEEFGLDSTEYKSRQDLVAAIHQRRQLIASLDREAMLDVIRWGRRPVSASANREQIAQEISRIRSMKFNGLSQRGLVVLAKLRGTDIPDDLPVPLLIKSLKKKEGLFAKLNRKRRAALGTLVANMIGEEETGADYQFLPAESTPAVESQAAAKSANIKQDIEESGLFGGITNRIKKTADAYLNQKLDEVEARIDRKLDEIDRRLAEWRDKEIANRIRILKITLWASVIVCIISLLYTYAQVYFPHQSSNSGATHQMPYSGNGSQTPRYPDSNPKS
jgi:hypothetical protein